MTMMKNLMEKIVKKIKSDEVVSIGVEEENLVDEVTIESKKKLKPLPTNVDFEHIKSTIDKKRKKKKEVVVKLKNKEPEKIAEELDVTDLKEIKLTTKDNDFVGKRCPLCNSKVHHTPVFPDGEFFVQIFKCKNKSCPFIREVRAKV